MRVSLVLLLALLGGNPANGSQAGNAPVILILGDSLSAAYDMPVDEGWPALLEDRLQAAGLPHKVVNASVSGETTAGGASRLPRLLDEYEPAIVIIALGGNDGLRHLPAAEIRRNLDGMLARVRGTGGEPVLAAVQLPPNYGPHYLDEFDAIFPEVADRHDATLVPHLLEGVGDEQTLMSNDGIHPTAEAQPRILDNVWQALEPLLDQGS